MPLHQVCAAEIRDVTIQYRDDVYEVRFQAQLEAPLSNTWCQLTDFNNLHRLSTSIVKSEWLERRGKVHLVEVRSEGCAMFYCRRLHQTQRVSDMGEGYLLVEDVADHSDFEYATAMWHIQPHDRGSRVTYRAVFKPGFWMPPVVGPWVFQDALEQQTRTMITNLEKLANEKI